MCHMAIGILELPKMSFELLKSNGLLLESSLISPIYSPSAAASLLAFLYFMTAVSHCAVTQHSSTKGV